MGTTTTIGNGAFSSNRLISVTVPSSVTSIEVLAFAFNQLTNVTIPGSVTSIGEKAFAENKLVSITIGANVNVPANAFDNGFVDAYTKNKQKAGTYTLNEKNKKWGFKAQKAR